MVSLDEQIAELKERLRKTTPNKATMKSICHIKAQIAKLEGRRMDRIFEGIGKSTGGEGFDVKKTGDSSVALIGFPSVGKSTLLNKLTNAKSKIAAYEFTTLDAIPGLMEYKHARIMVIDLPGIIKGASKGKGFVFLHLLATGCPDVLSRPYSFASHPFGRFARAIFCIFWRICRLHGRFISL